MTTSSASTVTEAKAPPTYLAWIVWGLAAAFYFYEYFLQVSPGVMVPDLMQAFNVNATTLGNLAACYFYAYAGMQIPVGVLLDRFGPRRLLTFATLVCALGCLLFGTAFHLAVAELGRFLIGIGSAFAIISCLKLAINWFPAKRFALLTGLTVTLGMLGAIIGQAPLAILVEHIGWRTSMMLLMLVGIILCLSIWHLIRDKPPQASSVTGKATLPPVALPLLIGINEVIRNKQTWLVAIYCGLMFAPTSIFGSLWGVPFLMQMYNLTRPDAAAIVSLLFIGWAIGAPVAGWFSEQVGKKLLPAKIGAIGSLIALLLMIYIPVPLSLLYIILFAFGFFSSGFIPAFSMARELHSDYASATALGFINMLNMVGGAGGQPLVGWLLDLSWNGTLHNGVRTYSTANYHLALAVLPICCLLALLTLKFVRESSSSR